MFVGKTSEYVGYIGYNRERDTHTHTYTHTYTHTHTNTHTHTHTQIVLGGLNGHSQNIGIFDKLMKI